MHRGVSRWPCTLRIYTYVFSLSHAAAFEISALVRSSLYELAAIALIGLLRARTIFYVPLKSHLVTEPRIVARYCVQSELQKYPNDVIEFPNSFHIVVRQLYRLNPRCFCLEKNLIMHIYVYIIHISCRTSLFQKSLPSTRRAPVLGFSRPRIYAWCHLSAKTGAHSSERRDRFLSWFPSLFPGSREEKNSSSRFAPSSS